jgi:hypothetical protein
MNTQTQSDRALDLVEHYADIVWDLSQDAVEGNLEDLLCDILVDLRHLCANRNIDLHELLARSYRHFLEERRG